MVTIHETPCEHRIVAKRTGKKISIDIDNTPIGREVEDRGFFPYITSSIKSDELQQEFTNGACSFLTFLCGGPVECQQPQCSEANCPDIAKYIADAQGGDRSSSTDESPAQTNMLF